MLQTENSKLAFKHWSTIVILAIIAGFVGWFLLNLGPVLQYFNEKYADYKLRQMIERIQEPYKNDIIGGETPEETFDMFVAALKNDDMELASKYFVIKDQESWLKTFKKYEDSNLINDFVIELENINRSNVSFEKYPSGIWKINLL